MNDILMGFSYSPDSTITRRI